MVSGIERGRAGPTNRMRPTIANCLVARQDFDNTTVVKYTTRNSTYLVPDTINLARYLVSMLFNYWYQVYGAYAYEIRSTSVNLEIVFRFIR